MANQDYKALRIVIDRARKCPLDSPDSPVLPTA